MTYFKSLLTIFLSLIILACNNEEIGSTSEINSDNPIVLDAMEELMEQYDDFGNLENSENPTGNMTLDFCFDFIYPISFELNNGSEISVNNIDELIEILFNSNEELYVNNIIYPFDVEIFNHETNSFEIITIENDESFEMLLLDCDFDEEEYVCTEEFDPVCVEVMGHDNEVYIIAYPNSCWAELDGFSADDFLEDCDYEGHWGPEDGDGGFADDLFGFDLPCGELVFPISVVTPNGDVISVDNYESLIQVLESWYDQNPNADDEFELIFPLTIEFETETIEITSHDMLEEVLGEYCDEDWEGEDDEFFWFDLPCGELVFPISVVAPNGDLITGDSAESLIQAIESWYDQNPNSDDEFELIFPLTLEFETETIEITSHDMLEEVLEEYCDEDWEGEDDDDDEDDDEDEDDDDEDDDNDDEQECESCSDEENIVCVQYTNPTNPNDIIVEAFLNPCYAICAGFSEDDFVDCE